MRCRRASQLGWRHAQLLRGVLLAGLLLLARAAGRRGEDARPAHQLHWANPRKPHRSQRQAEDAYVYARPPPEGWQHWLRFARERKCALGAYDKLEADLRPFRDPAQAARRSIPHSSVRQALALSKTCAFQVRGGLVAYWEASPSALAYARGEYRCGWLLEAFQAFQQHLPDMEFAVNADDVSRAVPGTGSWAQRFGEHCRGASQEFRDTWHMHGYFICNEPSPDKAVGLLPLFSSTGIAGCFRDIVVPPPQNLNLAQHEGGQEARPWGERDPRLYFRGTSTGCTYTDATYGRFLDCHRQRLVLAARNDTRMDIGLTAHIQCEPHICARMGEALPTVAPLPESEGLRRKHVMVVDGNSYSSRLQTALSTGSLIFRAGLFDEWYEDRLQPYEHYLPVAFDFSDLGAQLEWALAHGAEARAIAERAGALARERLRPEDAACYWFRALLEYAALVDWGGNATAGPSAGAGPGRRPGATE